MTDSPNQPAQEQPGVAAPGPHPHESADFGKWAGTSETGERTSGLPEGVEPFQGTEPEAEEDEGTV